MTKKMRKKTWCSVRTLYFSDEYKRNNEVIDLTPKEIIYDKDVYDNLNKEFKGEYFNTSTVSDLANGVSSFSGIGKDGKSKTIKVYKNHFNKDSITRPKTIVDDLNFGFKNNQDSFE